jgi:hypothetical protein
MGASFLGILEGKGERKNIIILLLLVLVIVGKGRKGGPATPGIAK